MESRWSCDKLIRYYRFEEINRAFDDARSETTIKPILRVGAA
jgi:Zn-dependent alcohol dehydrogenase